MKKKGQHNARKKEKKKQRPTLSQYGVAIQIFRVHHGVAIRKATQGFR